MARGSLQRYRAKRDFSQTSEPRGMKAGKPAGDLRFVIQKHAARRLHYDFRLELDGVFKSWAVTRGPSLDPADKRLAVEVEDHPLEYGDFEGTIPRGQYGGGIVQLWDRGFWFPEGPKTPAKALVDGDLKFSLKGSRLGGSWVLVRMRRDRDGGKRNNWLLIKHRDASAKPGAGDSVLAEDRSVASGRTMAQIGAGKGKAPAPFIRASGRTTPADAIWNGPEEKAAGLAQKAAPAPATPPTPKPAATPIPKPRTVTSVPSFVEPQLCKLVEQPPSSSGWGHEVKLDGYRVQLDVRKKRATLRTRTGLDWTSRFTAIAEHAAQLPDCMIDGEIVALDAEGLPSFAALQAALSDEHTDELVFFGFDLLFEYRKDYRALPLSARKQRLAQLLAAKGIDPTLRFVEHVESDAAAVLESACRMHLEGIVSKKLDAPYRSGRSGFWTKAKCRAGQEVVLGGWTFEGKTVRSLLAGVYRDGALVYVGRIGTGYGAAVVRTLQPRLEALTTDESPFTGPDAPRAERTIRWLKPTLVAEIAFAGWTGSGMIRQAAFKGLREDKPAREIVAEQPGPPAAKGKPMPPTKAPRSTRSPSRRASSQAALARTASRARRTAGSGSPTVLGVTLSHPDKALWPDAGDGEAVTKLDLARYFEAVGEWMLPHLKGRPCSLVRAPDGIQGAQFFQRHATPGMAKVFSQVKVRGDKAPYVQIDRVEALAAVAQIGALELHPWNCAPDRPEVAGRLVFDLDPAPDVPFEAVIDAAVEVRDRLVKLGLVAFCKTTGGKGLHVVVPLATDRNRAFEWPPAKQFAHLVCAKMAADSPTKYLDNMSKSKRAGRIFLDYLRNDRTSTAVAPLSPRARAGATVSMPIAWQQVRHNLAPNSYTVRSAPALLRRSAAWAEYEESARPLADAIRSITASNARVRRGSTSS